MRVQVRFQALLGFSPEEKGKIISARNYLEATLNTNEFREAVLNHTWLGKKTFADNQGFTNEEIYNLIMSGKEVINPVADGIIQIGVAIYSPFIRGRSTVAYTFQKGKLIFFNRNFFNKFNEAQIAGTLLHEALHCNFGFYHDFKSTAKREYSVPYSCGRIVTKIAEKAL